MCSLQPAQSAYTYLFLFQALMPSGQVTEVCNLIFGPLFNGASSVFTSSIILSWPEPGYIGWAQTDLELECYPEYHQSSWSHSTSSIRHVLSFSRRRSAGTRNRSCKPVFHGSMVP